MDDVKSWETMLEVCFKRQIDPVILTQPQKHRDGVSVTKRALVVRDLYRVHHIGRRAILRMLGISDSQFWRMISAKRLRSAVAAKISENNACISRLRMR